MNINALSSTQFSANRTPSNLKYSLRNGRIAHTVAATTENKAKFPRYVQQGNLLIENPISGEFIRRKKSTGVWYLHPDPNSSKDIPDGKKVAKDKKPPNEYVTPA